MSPTWYGETPPPEAARIGLAGWLRAALKGGVLAAVLAAGFALLLLFRLPERLFCRTARPVTAPLVVMTCRVSLRVIGLRVRRFGAPSDAANAIVANHASWLDILVLNACRRVYFVSKAEVAGWPGIGLLAQATGTVFIARERARAADQARLFSERLSAGHRLLFFPEGTSSDGQRVLPFKSTLFAAFFEEHLRAEATLQPVALRYEAPPGADPRFYGWWGDMELGPHVLSLLAAPRQGHVELTWQPPLPVARHPDRKTLAAASEASVRAGHGRGGAGKPSGSAAGPDQGL